MIPKPSHAVVPLVLLAGLTACTTPPEPQEAAAPPPTPKNIVFFLADGMGHAHVKAYRAYADDPDTHVIEPLAFDGLLVGSIATDSIALECETEDPETCVRNPYGVTDSAASATAYATGRDTVNGMLGQGPDGERFTSVLERAAELGKGTGVVSTSQITHASPAAFVVHVPERRDYPAIADQFHDNQVDGRPTAQVILGGGVQDFRREDRDVAAELVNGKGYQLLETAEELDAADGDRLLGLFAPVGMPRKWDRPDSVPSLAAMTSKAIETLSRNDKGFFLFIEGSQVDWAAHGKDIAGVMSEMEDFLGAVEVGLTFAAGRDDTLIIVTADHETGGMSVGRDGQYAWNPRPLRTLKATPALMVKRFSDGEESLASVLEAHSDITVSVEEQAALEAAGRDPDAAYYALVDLLSARSSTGWTTDGHTGIDVPLYATGPGSDALTGTMENEALGQQLMEWMTP